MKNNFKNLVAFLFTASILLTSCSEEKGVFDRENGPTAYLFSRATTSLPVTPTGTSVARIEVGVTTKSTSDRRIPIKIDAASTALPAEYTITDASLVIPAGNFVGTIEVVGNFNAIPAGVTRTLIINLDESTGLDVIDNKGKHTIALARFCATALAGTYSVTTTYGYHDFLPAYATNTMMTTITAGTAVNTYRIADFTGGLYSTGPYATTTIAGYQTGTAANAANRDLTFVVNCGAISWTGERDLWGPVVPSTTAGSVNALNTTTGSFTISWTSSFYGENGVSVYTKQ